jgi:hypothetical protein
MTKQSMTVIKNGIEEEMEIQHYEHFKHRHDMIQYQSVPVMNTGEFAKWTVDGKCYIFEGAE